MTETLNIFKLTEHLLMELTRECIPNNMSRLWRHIFYPKMIEVVLYMHSLAFHANTDTERRAEYLRSYLGSLKQVESLTRVAHERRMITHRQTDNLFRIYESLQKQASAWRKKSKPSHDRELQSQDNASESHDVN